MRSKNEVSVMKVRNVVVLTMLMMVSLMSGVFASDRVSLGFLYGISEPVELVERTNGAINQVAPTCLNLSSKGKLVVTSELTHDFVQAMKEKGILVTPFLSNHWVRSKGRAAIKQAETLARDLAAVVQEYDLDGINVDIENLTPDDKDGFTELVRQIRAALPEDKMVTVCVAANPEASESGWQGSYDYTALGEIADYLFVMTYDEHSQGGAAGPVASLEFIEKSIQYALEHVEKDKIVLGIPFYGRFWRDGAETGGEAVVIGAIPSLISKNHGVVYYDETIGEARVTFQVNSSMVPNKINGVELEDGTYTIWYPTEASIKATLNLVNEYDLLGAGVWALGQEKVDVWNYFKEELNRIPYVTPEEEEEEKIREAREAYEALVVDVSKLEMPELFPLTYEKEWHQDWLEAEKKMEENVEEEARRVHLHAEEQKEVEYVVMKDHVQVKNDEKKQKQEEPHLLKRIHIFRFCHN